MDNKKYTTVAIVLALFIVTLLPTSCVMHANSKVAEMTAAGANPIEAKCAIWSDSGNGMCQTYLFTKGGNNGQ